MTGHEGTVYLLHFVDAQGRTARLVHAGHYIGWAAHLAARLAHHRAGRGARLIAAARLAGLDFEVTATWPGTRELERRLKRRHGAGRFCPRCIAESTARQSAAV